MSKIEDLMIEHTPQSIIEIGQILENFYNSQSGAIFRAIVNGKIKEQISQMQDVTTNADRRLGRAEGIQMIQDEIELAIAHMQSLTQPIPQGEQDG